MLTNDSSATASFSFTGIAIYFWSPLWPYTVSSAISLDSGPITLVDLVDHSRPAVDGGPETVQSKIVWSATGLANTQHNLLISVGAGEPYAVVDALMYTDATVVSSSSSSSSSTTSRSSTLSPTTSTSTFIVSPTANTTLVSKSRSTSAIAVGSLFGILAFLVIVLCGVWYFRRWKKSAPGTSTIAPRHYTPLFMTGDHPTPSAGESNATNRNWTADGLYNNGYDIDVIQPQYNDGKTLFNLRYENVGSPATYIPSQPGGYQDSTSSRILNNSTASYAEINTDGRDYD